MSTSILDEKEILKSFTENASFLEKRYRENIEKYRKGKFFIKFSGNGVKKVTIRQKTHSFLFGCNAFMLDSMESKEKEALYKTKFSRLFNQAVVPLYWNDLEPREGNLRFGKDSEKIYRRPATDVVLDFCKEYGIEPKGHCLLWNNCNPDWLEKYTIEERKQKVEKRFKEISKAYAGEIPSFDVVNESASNYNLGRKALFERYDEFALMLGEKYFSKNRKIINEWNYATWETYVSCGKYMPFNMQLQKFIEKGLPIDEIGLQFHIFTKLEDLAKQSDIYLNVKNHLEVLDIFSEYGLPMHISEITIPSYPNGLPENEEIQAQLVGNYYKLWFATPQMKSIVWWNAVDGYAAYAPRNTWEGENYYGGGLLRYDMSEKPSYRVLDELINREWKTNLESEVFGNEYSFKGFYGEYEIIADGKKYNVKLDKDGKEALL